jgi:hypothetical protein
MLGQLGEGISRIALPNDLEYSAEGRTMAKALLDVTLSRIESFA